MGILKLLGPDQSTVLWDFDDPTGAANPSTVQTDLRQTLDLGIEEVLNRIATRQTHGGDLLGYDLSPVEIAIPFKAKASTDVDLWTGLGQLGRYLLSVAGDHPLFLEWTSVETRYMDVVGVLALPQLLTGEPLGSLAAARAQALPDVTVRLLRQPWMRGASVTSAEATVPDDPATGTPDGSRIYAVTVTGDLPTPGKVRAEMDAGATVQRLLIGHRALKSRDPTTFSDYLSDTAWFQCEASGRNWTITLGADTSATAGGSGASVPSTTNVAAVSGSGTSAGTMTRRVRATRTGEMDSLRGSWVPYLRMLGTGSPYAWEVQLRWGPSTSDPVAFANDVVTFEGSQGNVAYVEKQMGRIDIPHSVDLSGMAVEIWARELTGSAGDLRLDLVDLWPAEGLASVVVPSAAPTVTFGADLTSPPDQISGDPTWISGSSAQTFVGLATDLAAVGLGPNTGTVYAAGRHLFTFDIAPNGSPTAELRIVNVTDNTVMDSHDLSDVSAGRYTDILALDADGSDAYQAQVTATDMVDGYPLIIYSITHQFFPSVLENESIRTDPARYAVDRLDSSGDLAGYLDVEGRIPAMLEPGANHLKLRADEIPIVGSEDPENDIGRDLTVSVTYDPRYAL